MRQKILVLVCSLVVAMGLPRPAAQAQPTSAPAKRAAKTKPQKAPEARKTAKAEAKGESAAAPQGPPLCPHFDGVSCHLWEMCWSKNASACQKLRKIYETFPRINKRFQKFKSKHEARCEKGDFKHCMMLVRVHMLGVGEKKSTFGALRAYLKACEVQPETCKTMKKLYRRIVFLEKKGERVNLFKKLCKKGFALACYDLAMVHERGLYNTPQNPDKARTYFNDACEKKHAKACYYLGALYQEGLNFALDLHKAQQLYAKACFLRLGRACLELGRLFLHGLGVEQSCQGARLLYDLACKHGEQSACTFRCNARILKTLASIETPAATNATSQPTSRPATRPTSPTARPATRRQAPPTARPAARRAARTAPPARRAAPDKARPTPRRRPAPRTRESKPATKLPPGKQALPTRRRPAQRPPARKKARLTPKQMRGVLALLKKGKWNKGVVHNVKTNTEKPSRKAARKKPAKARRTKAAAQARRLRLLKAKLRSALSGKGALGIIGVKSRSGGIFLGSKLGKVVRKKRRAKAKRLRLQKAKDQKVLGKGVLRFMVRKRSGGGMLPRGNPYKHLKKRAKKLTKAQRLAQRRRRYRARLRKALMKKSVLGLLGSSGGGARGFGGIISSRGFGGFRGGILRRAVKIRVRGSIKKKKPFALEEKKKGFSKGMRKIFKEQLETQRKACHEKNAQACLLAGWLLEQRSDDQKEDKKGKSPAHYYARSCALGHASGCLQRALATITGNQIKQPQTAKTYFQKACKQGSGRGCTALGLTTEAGWWKGQDAKDALRWYQKGCKLGHGEACTSLGRHKGKGKPTAQARAYIVQGCKLGDGNACLQLAHALRPKTPKAAKSPKSPKATQPKKKASLAKSPYFSYLKRACRLFVADACFQIARLLQKGALGLRDPEEAQGYDEKACRYGSPAGCYRVARRRHKRAFAGLFDVRSYNVAARLYLRSCKQDHASSCFQIARMAFYREDLLHWGLKKTSKHIHRACKLGSARGCHWSGHFTQRGIGTQPSLSEALASYRKACKLGDKGSCFRVGWMLHEGLGAKAQTTASHEVLGRNCQKEHALSCLYLARYLNENKATQKDAQDTFARYVSLSKKFHKLGKGYGAFYLARAYEKGYGVKKDPTKAKKLYEEGCWKNNLGACLWLADAYRKGTFEYTKNTYRAENLYRWACWSKHPRACRQMAERMKTRAMIYYRKKYGRYASYRKRYYKRYRKQAQEYYNKGCELGGTRSCLFVGDAHRWGTFGFYESPTKAYKLYQRACAIGSGKACLLSATMLRSGEGIERNTKRAQALLLQACQLKNSDACGQIGAQWQKGSHGKPNLTKALKYYQKACDQKHATYCRKAATLHKQGKGTPRNCDKANQLYKRSCKLGAWLSCHLSCKNPPKKATDKPHKR